MCVPWKRVLAFVLVLAIVLLGVAFGVGPDKVQVSTAYWLWAGLTAKDAPPNSELYVFQGTLTTHGDSVSYERLGLYPHPLKCSKLYLVYRLENSLPACSSLLAVFDSRVKHWQRHKVPVRGLQLDFDSPTAKLPEYARFLEDLRAKLPAEYALSVTGLGDWASSGSPEAMKRIAASTDEIVFQLYQGRQPLPEIEKLAGELFQYPHPFRVGLVHGFPEPRAISALTANRSYRGIVYFLRRDM